MFKRYVTMSEAASLTGLSVDTIRRRFDEGHFHGHRSPGGHRRVDVLSLPKSNRPTAPPADTTEFYRTVMGDSEASRLPNNLDLRRSPIAVTAHWATVSSAFPYWEIPANLDPLDLQAVQQDIAEISDNLQSLHGHIQQHIEAVDRAAAESSATPSTPPVVDGFAQRYGLETQRREPPK